MADRDLVDCRAAGLSSDWRLNIAYNAGLQAATAALAAAGFRAGREAHHYRVIQSLAYTVGADSVVIARFDAFRKKRNIGGYERVGTVSDAEADEMIAFAEEVRMRVKNWIAIEHPDLL